MYRRYVHQRLKKSLRKHNDGHYQWAKKSEKSPKRGASEGGWEMFGQSMSMSVVMVE